MLSKPGIGQLSPTMARQKGRRRVGKDHLAMAVKKDFNAATVVEAEVIPFFIYAIHHQGSPIFALTYGLGGPVHAECGV